MKKLIIILLLFFTMTGYCQKEIGYTKDEVLKEYPNATLVELKNFSYLYNYSTNGTYTYFLNQDSICYECGFTPKSDLALQSYIDYYNTNFNKISENKWLSNFSPIVLIELTYHTKTDKYYFTYSSYIKYEKNAKKQRLKSERQ